MKELEFFQRFRTMEKGTGLEKYTLTTPSVRPSVISARDQRLAGTLCGSKWRMAIPSEVNRRLISIIHTFLRALDRNKFLGCPVEGRSCNSSSELPEENNVISIETTAYTYSECSG